MWGYVVGVVGWYGGGKRGGVLSAVVPVVVRGWLRVSKSLQGLPCDAGSIEESPCGIGVRLDGAVSTTEPFALRVYSVA